MILGLLFENIYGSEKGQWALFACAHREVYATCSDVWSRLAVASIQHPFTKAPWFKNP